MALMGSESDKNHPLDRTLSRALHLNWQTAITIVILLLAIFTRFYILGERVMSHDESLHTRFSYNLYADGDFQHTPLMHGPILFHATAFAYYLFGDNDFTSRIYTAILGVLMVMSPLLFRRWLGRWGAILASFMLLISPLVMYYNRYIRHDTPSILFGLIMLYAIMMYISGPAAQRRRAHWLYVLAAAMILNLGSKETAFIYVAVFGIFVFLYWLVRMAQHAWKIAGKTVFYLSILGILIGGVLSLGLYIILDIVQFDLFPGGPDAMTFFELSANDQAVFWSWTALAVVLVITLVIASMLWVYRRSPGKIQWRELIIMLVIALLTCFVLVVVEEISHTTATSSTETAPPPVPGEGVDSEVAMVASTVRWLPMVGVWLALVLVVGGVIVHRLRSRGLEADQRARGLWGSLRLFPEFDVIIIIGTLILPWATALVPYLMKPSSTDLVTIAESLPEPVFNFVQNIPAVAAPADVGQVVLGFAAWLPLMIIAVVVGLAWNWRRWLVAAAIFHVIFAFFFTTMFTNMVGLASGMVYSLGYWLEQQGVRRGSQPQYYYLLVIMPVYEFLPIIGGVLAMIAGLVLYWRRRLGLIRDAEALENDIQHQLASLSSEHDDDDARTPEQIEAEQAEHEAHRAALEAEAAQQQRVLHERSQLRDIPFLLFVAWLAVLNLVGYSLAGEKMPWLGTHLTTPMIFLTGWYFGRIVQRISWRRFAEQGWIMLLLLIALIITALQVVAPLFVGGLPFSGLEQAQLQNTYRWLGVLVIALVIAGVIFSLVARTGWRHLRHVFALAVFLLLSVITLRSAWMASFINYDLPTEYLVYAHAAPAIKDVLDEIDELSFRTTDGPELRFAYDNEVSWPYSWYFRDYPNAVFIGGNPTMQNLEDTAVVVVGDGNRGKVEPILEDRYLRFDHMRLWWPMQEYFYLTPDRVNNLLDLSPSNTDAAARRRGLFDIWWSRDYTAFGQAASKDYSLTNWPVSDRMHFYVRKDIASQIWSYGLGEGTAATLLDPAAEESLCTSNWLELAPVRVFDQPADGSLIRPLGLDIAPDGLIYVAEENANRISIYDQDGVFIRSVGAQGAPSDESLSLTRPNSVSVGPDGRLYIADTWNYQIQVFDPTDDTIVARWGQPGEFGIEAPAVPEDAFWGPRDVSVDEAGRIYVADTGNKRVRVYQLVDDGSSYLYDIGQGGSGPGQLDEPSSVAIHPDGRVFVADTWNRRISVFNTDGLFINSFSVRAWYEERGNRPYLALDAARDLLYVTDPDAGRVLVYDVDGDCVGAFGQLASDVPIDSQFGVVGGIVVDKEGFVYVADAALNRVVKYLPFPVPEPELLPQGEGSDMDTGAELTEEPKAGFELELEVTDEPPLEPEG